MHVKSDKQSDNFKMEAHAAQKRTGKCDSQQDPGMREIEVGTKTHRSLRMLVWALFRRCRCVIQAEEMFRYACLVRHPTH